MLPRRVISLAWFLAFCAGFLTFTSPVPADQAGAKKPAAVLAEKAAALQKNGDAAKAAGVWEQVVKQNPVRADYWYQLATAHYQAKSYRPAIAAYEQSLALRANYPFNSAYNIACCYALLGEKEPALAWLEKAFQIGFRDLAHAQTDEDFESLRDDPKFRTLVALTDVSKLSRDEGWRYDLQLLAREIKRRHPNPYRTVPREQFDAYVQKLHDDIPKLKDGQVMVGLMKLGAMAGDGHTFMRPGGPRQTVPLQLFLFTEGVFVTAAAPEQADLAGAEVLKIGGHKVADVLAALDPLISRDNAMGPKALGPHLLGIPALLHALDLISEADKAPYTVRDAAGKERTVTLSAGEHTANEKWANARKGASRPAPLYLKNQTAPYWFEHVTEAKLVYFQYNAVRNGPEETLEKFCERLFKFVNENDVEKLVLDLRRNGGGNSLLNRPIIHGLIRCEKINQRGKLFVITGRHTFSAAQNCTTDLEMHTQALFVGEPTGSSPNFIGESVRLTLPYSKMTGSISDLVWGRSWPMDYRTWIAPQLYAPPSFALYKDNRDPALEAILEYRASAGN